MNKKTGYLLEQWALWAKRGRVAPQGYGASPMFADVDEGKVSAKPCLVITDDEAMCIDAIIAKLTKRDREMGMALVIFYNSGGNASHVARVLSAHSFEKIDRKRATMLVQSATAWIDACLCLEGRVA